LGSDAAAMCEDFLLDSEEFWLTGCHVEDIRATVRAREESGEEIRKWGRDTKAQEGVVNDGLYIGLRCVLPSKNSRVLGSLTLVWDWDWDWDGIGSKPWVRLISWDDLGDLPCDCVLYIDL
jgi:hypothetical protein